MPLSVIATLAVSVPSVLLACGVNVTLIVQFAFAASVFGLTGQVFVCAKSPAFVPVSAILLIVRGVVLVLVRVTVCAELVVPIF